MSLDEMQQSGLRLLAILTQQYVKKHPDELIEEVVKNAKGAITGCSEAYKIPIGICEGVVRQAYRDQKRAEND